MNDDFRRYMQFLNSWEPVFRKIPSILNIVSSYPELCSRINFVKPLNFDHLHRIQFEWISLISRFNHPIETSFFKEYYVPIEEDSYDYFIDMSCKGFPVFFVSYFQLEPQHWYKIIVFSDINELINFTGKRSFYLDKHFEEFRLKKREMVNKKVEQRELLEKPDKRQILPIKKNDLFMDGDKNKHLIN